MSERLIPDITPVDPDVVVITDWLAGELHGEELAAVEQRLRDDEAFWMKAGPLVKLWNLPINYESLLAKYPAVAAVSVPVAERPVSDWARSTAAAIVRGVGAEPLPVIVPATAPASAPHIVLPGAAKVAPAVPLTRGERIFRYWFSWAGETTPPGPGHYWARIKWSYGTMLLGAFGVDRRKNPPESIVDKSPTLSLVWERVGQGMAMAGLAAIVFIFGMGFYSTYKDSDDSSLIRRAVHVVTRPPLLNATKLETQPSQEVAFTLPSGTRATVRGRSRLEWNAAGAVLLRGTATFEVPTTVSEQRVLTDYGDVRMGPGQYALGRSGDGKLVLISVVAGLARLRPDTTDVTAAGEIQIGPGEFGSLSSRGFASTVEPRDATEHPSFARERTALRSSATPGGLQRWRQFSWVRLAPGSRMTWDVGNPAIVFLTGEMAMVLDSRDGATLVQTDFGQVVLRTGSFAVKTATDFEKAAAMLVTSRRGRAWMIPDTASVSAATGAAVEAGQFGFSRNGVPRMSEGGAIYPSTIPDSLAPRTPFGTTNGVRP